MISQSHRGITELYLLFENNIASKRTFAIFLWTHFMKQDRSFFKSADLKAQITRDMEKYIHKSMENWMQDQPIYIQDESKNVKISLLLLLLLFEI